MTRLYPYPPVFGGEISYSRSMIEALAPACALTVLAFTNGVAPIGRHDGNGVHWDLVPRSQRLDELSLLTGMPNIMWRNATAAYHAALHRLLAQPWDGVILDHFASAHALPALARWRARHPDRRVLYIAHEHERTARREKYASYGGWWLRRALMRLDHRKIAQWEDRVLDAVDVVSLINPRERPLFEARNATARFVVAPPAYRGDVVARRVIDRVTPRRVAVLGGRGSLHKQAILRDWLAVSASRFAAANIEIDVIGPIGARLRAELAQRHPHVRFSGFVEDLAAHLQTCRLGIVPDTVGRGVKVRLASYVMARLPMAAMAGAIDGLPLTAGTHHREAPTLPALAALCIDLVDDLRELNRLQHAAFAACGELLDWRRNGETLVAAITGDGGRATASPDVERLRVRA